MKRGFTLVELSIVLVIIGLLIGGILVAQSMVSAAKTTGFIRDLGKYEISINNFLQNYRYYPGDSGYFQPPGNQDKAVHLSSMNPCADAPNDAYSAEEFMQVWGHLSQSKMIDTEYPAFSPNGGCAGGIHDYMEWYGGRYTPATELDQGALGIGLLPKYYIQTAKPSADTNFVFTMHLKAQMVMALENKLGSKTDDYSYTQIGLANSYGLGNCVDASINVMPCGNPGAEYGALLYLLEPL